MNSVNVIGNLTRDPQGIGSEGETGVSFSIAYNSYYKDKKGEKVTRTDFFECVCFVNTDNIKKYLKKGSAVGITGRLRQDRWEKNGENFSKVVIVANSIKFLTPKKRMGEEAEDTIETAESETSDWG